MFVYKSTLIRCAKCAKCQIFGTFNTKHKNKPSSAVLNLKKFGTCLQYRLKYETVRTKMPYTIWLYLIRFFSLLHHLSLSVCNASLSVCNPSLSLSVWHSHRHLATPISPRRETETAQARHWSLTHFTTKRNSSVKDTVAGSENFHQRRRRLSWSDCRSWKVHWRRREKKKGLCRFNLWF